MPEQTMAALDKEQNGAATQRVESEATRLLNLGETDLTRTGDLSPEGRKKIRYRTGSWSILPKEIRRDYVPILWNHACG